MAYSLKAVGSANVGTSPVVVYTNPGGGVKDIVHSLIVSNVIVPVSITSITRSGTTATVTTGSAHGLTTGNFVSIENAYPSAYSAEEVPVTVVDTTHFTYQIPFDPGANAAVVGNLVVLAKATVTWTDSSAGATYNLAKQVLIPSRGSLVPVGDNNKIVLESGDSITVTSDIAASLDASLSFLEG